METKKCSNCGKFMIEWMDNKLFGVPTPNTYHFKCACGNSEFSRIEESVPSFQKAWEKANGE